MITIQSGKMKAPEEDRFVGFAGGDRSIINQFIFPNRQSTDNRAVTSLDKQFNVGSVTSAPFCVGIVNSDTILTWSIAPRGCGAGHEE